jgi:hypothetical protein
VPSRCCPHAPRREGRQRVSARQPAAACAHEPQPAATARDGLVSASVRRIIPLCSERPCRGVLCASARLS